MAAPAGVASVLNFDWEELDSLLTTCTPCLFRCARKRLPAGQVTLELPVCEPQTEVDLATLAEEENMKALRCGNCADGSRKRSCLQVRKSERNDDRAVADSL